MIPVSYPASHSYGSETCALTKRHREKLETSKMSEKNGNEHARVSLIDRVRCIDIRRKTKLTDILSRIAQLKLRWTGHMLCCKKEQTGESLVPKIWR